MDKVRSYEEIMASIDKLAADREKAAAEAKERSMEFDRKLAEYAAERAKAAAEADKRAAEADKRTAEFDRKMAELNKSIADMGTEVKGISKSNGMVSEEYFYSALAETKVVGGIHYDVVERNMRAFSKQKNIRGQYDIVLINDEAVCIVEVKYRLRGDDIEEIAGRFPAAFRQLFPEYENYKIYLAAAGMAVEMEEGVQTEAKKWGVGILKLNGDAIEVEGEMSVF